MEEHTEKILVLEIHIVSRNYGQIRQSTWIYFLCLRNQNRIISVCYEKNMSSANKTFY